MQSVLKIVAVGALLAAFAPLILVAEQAAAPEAASAEVQLLFVQSAESIQADDKTLRLIDVAQQTIYFSDRPARLAGHMTMAEYLGEWQPDAKDSFAGNPPNASLSVYEAGQPDTTLSIVEISNPVIDGNDLVYSYKLIEGKVPSSGGATALFIDRIGAGGGVGVGFHGVGVGARGPGVR